MIKYLLIIVFFFLQIVLFSQNKTTKKVYVEVPDTSISSIAHFWARHNLDSSKVGLDFPILVAFDLNDSLFRQDTLKPIVFYNFWFTTCHPCIDEMPMFDSVRNEYAGRVDFVAVTFESKEAVQEFLTTHKFNFLHLLMNRRQLEDLPLTRGYPTTIITYNNKIVYCKYGGFVSSSKYYNAVMIEAKNIYQSIFDELLD